MTSTMKATWVSGAVAIAPGGSPAANAEIFISRCGQQLAISLPQFLPENVNPATYTGLGNPISADWCSHGEPQHLDVYKGTHSTEEWIADFLAQLESALALHEPTNDCA